MTMRARRRRVPVIALLLVGCATAPPPTGVTVDCRLLGMTPAPTERLEFPAGGFSLVPPRGGVWCEGTRQARRTQFGAHPLLGQTIGARLSPAEMIHSFGLVAISFEPPPAARLETPDEKFTFFLRQIVGVEAGSRFRVVESRVAADTTLGADCIRFDLTTEERNNPSAAGAVLVQVGRANLLCRHPDAGRPALIYVGASERYLQGTVSGSLLIDTRRAEWEPSVQSLRFLPRP